MKSCHTSRQLAFRSTLHGFTKKYTSILGLLIVVLPKCPVCIVAYSSAITLCGVSTPEVKTALYSDIRIYLALGLGVIILACILLSFTARLAGYLALTAATLGLTFLIVHAFHPSFTQYYYLGAAALIMATLAQAETYRKLFFKPSKFNPF